mgnify:FL=1
MIDTDKYEGHTPAPWKLDWSDTEAEINKGCEIHIVSANKEVLEKFTMNPSRTDGDAIYDPYITSISCGSSYTKGGEYITEANARLIADAPLLLEEVKRLREGIKEMISELTDGYQPTYKPIQKKLKEMIE